MSRKKKQWERMKEREKKRLILAHLREKRGAWRKTVIEWQARNPKLHDACVVGVYCTYEWRRETADKRLLEVYMGNVGRPPPRCFWKEQQPSRQHMATTIRRNKCSINHKSPFLLGHNALSLSLFSPSLSQKICSEYRPGQCSMLIHKLLIKYVQLWNNEQIMI